jgi:hypothetical protein
MGSGAQGKYQVTDAKGADKETITKGVADVAAVDKEVLKAAVEARLGTEVIAANFKQIATNAADLHELHLTVLTNKEGVYEARSMIEENRLNILKNYSAAFVGNRQMANQNTDDIFKNRFAILDALKCEGPVQENFRNSKYNEARIEFLENRSLLNNRVAKVNQELSLVNKDLIEINDKILGSNEEIVSFNKDQIGTNSLMLDGIKAETATADANKTRIESNKKKIENIKTKNEEYNNGMEAKHQLIKDNRTKITENAAAIKERRDQILANRKIIKENGTKVADKLRENSGCVDDLLAQVKDLSDSEAEMVLAALKVEKPDETATTTANRSKISKNEASLHQLHLEVMTNKEQLYEIRSIIEENRALILKNYAAAFVGNRQMANQNTEDIFKNRKAILHTIKTSTQVEENWRLSKTNEATCDSLEHRSKLNNRVQKVNELMSKANEKLIEINRSIMAGNEEIVKFNKEQIETNRKILEAGILPEKATPEANEERIASNMKRIEVIQERNAKYDQKCEEMMKQVNENRAHIIENAKKIDARRDAIRANRKNIVANGKKVCELITAE